MKFALIGAAGFIAPKHLNAIKEIGGELVAALDPHDNVGILDSYFPECVFFTEFERFDRYCSKLRTTFQKIDWVVVCSPNYLHDAHCRFGLRIDANVICEKPLVLKEKNLDELKIVEEVTARRIFTIMQLRLLKPITAYTTDAYIQGNMMYVTPRGLWYDYSWKGIIKKSGGLATNIGIHLFDYLIHSFGTPVKYDLSEMNTPRTVSGKMYFEKAEMNFYLSLIGNMPYRVIKIDGRRQPLHFPNITGLHNVSYKRIVNGNGFGIEDVRTSIRLCEDMRKTLNGRR